MYILHICTRAYVSHMQCQTHVFQVHSLCISKHPFFLSTSTSSTYISTNTFVLSTSTFHKYIRFFHSRITTHTFALSTSTFQQIHFPFLHLHFITHTVPFYIYISANMCSSPVSTFQAIHVLLLLYINISIHTFSLSTSIFQQTHSLFLHLHFNVSILSLHSSLSLHICDIHWNIHSNTYISAWYIYFL